ncbi:hypothetical protein Leryth_000641 [Lithospermum erythrorhizon]|nr:hypothetical protein Leryth_000641 [Lithospermum erythrorhizon]
MASLTIAKLCLTFTICVMLKWLVNVYSSLYPCLNYVQNGGPVPGNCCSGVKSILASANSKALRQSVCSCLKSAATAFRNVDLTNVKSLPGKCNVNIPYQITPNIDCSKLATNKLNQTSQVMIREHVGTTNLSGCIKGAHKGYGIDPDPGIL